jgi:hypothetical protein
MIVFAFVSVVIWTDARRKEREALYRAELLKKLAETPGPGADAVLASLREEDQRKHGRRREFVTLGGMLCLALSLAVLATRVVLARLMSPAAQDNSIWIVCFVPMLIGIALIAHARLVMGRAGKST